MDWTNPALIAHSECLIRIGKTGRRFRITEATVWNLLTPDGHSCGQSAMFTTWTFLD